MRAVHCRRIRRLVENELADILKERYALETEPEVPITYYLDFKTDERLLELQNVLERLDRGAYGRCISCGTDIRMMVLTAMPETRFCEPCQRLQSENAGAQHSGITPVGSPLSGEQTGQVTILKPEAPSRSAHIGAKAAAHSGQEPCG